MLQRPGDGGNTKTRYFRDFFEGWAVHSLREWLIKEYNFPQQRVPQTFVVKKSKVLYTLNPPICIHLNSKRVFGLHNSQPNASFVLELWS